MEFIIQLQEEVSSPVSQHVLPINRLMRRATADMAKRQADVARQQQTRRGRKGRDHLSLPSLSTLPLTITGRALVELCVDESDAPKTDVGDGSSMTCVIVRCAPRGEQSSLLNPLHVVPAGEMSAHIFDVQSHLLQPDQLVIFTQWASLGEVAVTESAVVAREATAAAAAAAHAADELHAPAEDDPATDSASHGRGSKRSRESPTSTINSGRSSLHPRLRAESTFEVVPAMTKKEDFSELNGLLVNGRLNLPIEVKKLLCHKCGQIPLVTLTMSCCGVALCNYCVPTPPTVTGASEQDRRCPHCCELPVFPPSSHSERDDYVSALVKELKVLYLPQLAALRERRGRRPSMQQSPSMTPSSDHTGTSVPYLIPSPPAG